MKTILLSGGRACATLELARMLHAAGHRVIMAEHIGWHLSRFTRAVARDYRVPWPTRDLDGFIDAIAHIIEREHVDLYIPTCEEIFHVARRRDRLPAAVYCDTLDALDRMHHKGRFVEAATAAGLATPPTTVVTDRAALLEALAEAPKAVLKPAYSRFAARTALWNPGDPPPDITPTAADPWLVQHFIAGRQLCTWGLAHQGHLTAHCAYATRYTLGMGASASFAMLEDPGVEAWARDFVAHTGFTGQIGLDLIEAEDGTLYGIEANPRITSGLHLFAHDPRILDALWTPDMPTLKPHGGRPAMLGVSMLLATRTLNGRAAWKAWWAEFRRCREVVWSLRDPIPVFWRYVWLAGVVLRGRRAGTSPQEAIGIDMEYNGER